MFKRRKMRFNGEWSLLAGNRVYELKKSCKIDTYRKSNQIGKVDVYRKSRYVSKIEPYRKGNTYRKSRYVNEIFKNEV
jgi:hypothetical protein